MIRTLLVDGDIYAYQIACSDQTDAVFDGVEMSTADLDTAKGNLDLLLDSFMERMDAGQMYIALSDPLGGNFRRDILPSYKANREDIVNPLVRRALEAHLRDKHITYNLPGLEGDDILGIWATRASAFSGTQKIVVTTDKDLRLTIPGHHWNPKKGDDLLVVTEDEADYGHLFQTLTGDPVDGYKGLPGVGPVKAKKILAHEGLPTPWDHVVHAYKAKGLTEEDALVQARCARILRASDFDFIMRQPILWSPA